MPNLGQNQGICKYPFSLLWSSGLDSVLYGCYLQCPCSSPCKRSHLHIDIKHAPSLSHCTRPLYLDARTLSTRAVERNGTRHPTHTFNYHLSFPFPVRTRSTSIIPVANHPWVTHLSTTFNPLTSIASFRPLSSPCSSVRESLARQFSSWRCIWVSLFLLYAVLFCCSWWCYSIL